MRCPCLRFDTSGNRCHRNSLSNKISVSNPEASEMGLSAHTSRGQPEHNHSFPESGIPMGIIPSFRLTSANF